MKKYLILGLLFFVSTTVFAKTNDFFNETTNIACVANSGGVTKSHKSEGDFKLERTCVSNEWVDVYTIKGSVVTKKDFYKKFEQYSLKGSTCTAKGTETIKVGSVKFKKVCGTAGKYATYYKNDKKVPYKDFMSLIASEQEKISKTGTTTSKTPGSQKNISEFFKKWSRSVKLSWCQFMNIKGDRWYVGIGQGLIRGLVCIYECRIYRETY